MHVYPYTQLIFVSLGFRPFFHIHVLFFLNSLQKSRHYFYNQKLRFPLGQKYIVHILTLALVAGQAVCSRDVGRANGLFLC